MNQSKGLPLAASAVHKSTLGYCMFAQRRMVLPTSYRNTEGSEVKERNSCVKTCSGPYKTLRATPHSILKFDKRLRGQMICFFGGFGTAAALALEPLSQITDSIQVRTASFRILKDPRIVAWLKPRLLIASTRWSKCPYSPLSAISLGWSLCSPWFFLLRSAVVPAFSPSLRFTARLWCVLSTPW